MEAKEEKPFADVLQGILHDEPVPVHFLYRLSDMPKNDQDAFFSKWPSLEGERRRIIIRHLADISEDNFVVDFSPIFTEALMDESDQVRLAAVDGIWDSSDKRFIPMLIRMMQNDISDDVKAAATSSLTHYVLMAEWGEISQRLATPIIDALLEQYDGEETAVAVRRATVEALGAASHERVPKIIQEAYEEEDLGMQLSAVFAMGNSADPKWLPTIINEMDNPNDQMRAEAARAAGSIGKSDAISDLTDLTEDDDLDVQLAAIHALGQIGGETSQEILNEILQDDSREDVHEAVELALEEMLWTTGDFNFLDMDFDEEM
ncbi:MAG: HEAT repeat domain-containing protein [Chloroflexota bacterium]